MNISNNNSMFAITQESIDISRILANPEDSIAGASVIFIGTAKDRNKIDTNTDTERISEIYYEAYKKMAEKAISSIEKEVLAKWHAKKFVAIHRIGNVKVNEISVVVAISTDRIS
jgi:molybdopterin synthase catalytic subunit